MADMRQRLAKAGVSVTSLTETRMRADNDRLILPDMGDQGIHDGFVPVSGQGD